MLEEHYVLIQDVPEKTREKDFVKDKKQGSNNSFQNHFPEFPEYFCHFSLTLMALYKNAFGKNALSNH